MERSLDTLPTELVLSITTWLDCAALLNAARVSQHLHDATVGHIYRHVYWIELEGHDGEGGPDRHLGCGLPDPLDSHLPLIPRGTRIFDIEQFSETIMKSNDLRHNIQAASFCWHAPPGTSRDLLLQSVYETLAPTTQFFHLSPPPQIGLPLAHYPATSLQIDGDQITNLVNFKKPLTKDGDTAISVEAERRLMHDIFASPLLTRLSLEDVNNWDFWNLPIVPAWRRTSNVTHLNIPMSSHPDEDLIEVLGWPKALKFFSYTVSQWMPQSIVFPVLSDALWQQHDTLEFILLGEYVTFSLADAVSAGRGLNEYPCLRVLGVQSQALTHSRSGGEEAAMERALYGLPPVLETLQIQLGGAWEKNTRYSELLPPWLRTLAARKATSTPILRLVILYAPRASKEVSDPEMGEEWLKTREAMRKSGISLRWTKNFHPPLSEPRPYNFEEEAGAGLTEGSEHWRIWDAYGIPRYLPTVV